MLQPPSSQAHSDSILWALPFCPMDWALTPPAVKITSPKPASTDQTTPDTSGNPTRPGGENVANLQQASSVGFPLSTSPSANSVSPQEQRGGRKGHPGKGPTLLSPSEVHLIDARSLCLRPRRAGVACAVLHPPSGRAATDRDGHPAISSCIKAPVAAVGGRSKPRYQASIRRVMARA